MAFPTGCILSKFYIKPQRCQRYYVWRFCCILSKFYIKPQQIFKIVSRNRGCILSKFYIKPQLLGDSYSYASVVSYRNSTSNHNTDAIRKVGTSLYLIEILHQTTTPMPIKTNWSALYLIEILHQTTTSRKNIRTSAWLYLIEILHQTTTHG